MAIASLVLGIFTILSCGFLGILGFVGVPLGHVARKKIRNSSPPQTGSGMALAGLIMGYIGIALFVLSAVLAVLGVVSDLSDPEAW